MEKWYRNYRRRTLLDDHINDWNPEFMRDFSAEQYVAMIQKMDANAVMINVQTHTGLCFWPTKSGQMHGAFSDRPDEFKKLFHLLQENGIKIIAYYSLVYNNWAYDKHISWRQVNPYGITSRQTGGRYGLCCPNNQEYREFTKAQIKEIFAYFPKFDGVFFDMPFWPMVCHCNSCKQRYADEIGGELPFEIDWKAEKWLRFQQKREEWMGEFAQFATNLVKEIDPECSVEHQYGNSFIDFWRRGVSENIANASDYIGTDLAGGVSTQSFACKAWYHLTKNQPFQYMQLPETQNRTTLKTREQLLRFLMMVYGHHGAALIIDDLKPQGKLDQRVYQRVGEIYREVEKYEPYLNTGELVADVYVLFNMEAKYNPENSPVPLRSKEAEDRYVPYVEGIINAVNILEEEHIPVGVITCGNIKQIHKGKVLVVSDLPRIQETALQEIDAYVSDGGTLYISGISAPQLIQKYFGLYPVRKGEDTITYLSPVSDRSEIFGEYDTEHPMMIPKGLTIYAGECKGEVLATATLPYNSPTTMGMFGENDGSIFLADEDKERRFVSIHENHPAKRTDYPLLAEATYQKGRIIWSAFPLEQWKEYPYDQLFASLIRRLGKDSFAFSADAPAKAQCILFRDTKTNRDLMTVVNKEDSRKLLPLVDLTIKIRSDRKPTAIWNITEGKAEEILYQDGNVVLKLPRLEVGVMFEISY